MTDTLTIRDMIRPMWILAAIVMTADAVSTYIGVTLYNAREQNPVMLWAFDTLTIPGALIAKAIVGIVAVWSLACRADRGYRWDWCYRLNLHPWRPTSQEQVQRSAVWALAVGFTITTLVVGGNLHALVAPILLQP